MTGFDIIVLLIVAVAAAGGFMRGFVQEMLSLAAWILALLAIRQFHTQVQALIEPQVGSATTAAIVAFALLLVPAAISFDTAMRRLGRRWKQLQRLVYPAFLLALIHWLLLDWAWGPALVHLAPLLVAWTLRMFMRRRTIVTRSIA